jgi:hypothetical protein
MKSIFLGLILTWLISLIQGQVEFDVLWNFDQYPDPNKSGWANATSEVIDMETYVDKGELRCSITGWNPVLDSPALYLNITNRHYLVMRARYQGRATTANLLLRSGASPSPNPQLLATTAYWEGRLPIQPISGISTSSINNHNYSINNLFDNNIYTTFYAANRSLVNIVMDLQSYRYIIEIVIHPISGINSPKRCLLMASMTSGIGPFQTVKTFTINSNQGYNSSNNQNYSNSGFEYSNYSSTDDPSNTQSFGGFHGYARYWKLVILDNYGGEYIGIREIVLNGYDERVTVVPFSLTTSTSTSTSSDSSSDSGVGTSSTTSSVLATHNMYYLPLHTYFNGILLRMRLQLLYPTSTSTSFSNANSTSGVANSTSGLPTIFRESLDIDYIHIIRAPVFWKIRGCIDQYYETANYQSPQYNISQMIHYINNHLPHYSFRQHNLSYQYATTYNCPLTGNILITIEGENFGNQPRVTVGNKPCPVVRVSYSTDQGRIQQLVCRLPPGQTRGLQRVRVTNGYHPALYYEFAGLSYRVAPVVPTPPQVTNIAAYKVDLVWQCPGDDFMKLTVTGYKIVYFPAQSPQLASNITVGNITTTSIRGLSPGIEYVFAIAAIAEGIYETAETASTDSTELLPTDLYGRRAHLTSETLTALSYSNLYGSSYAATAMYSNNNNGNGALSYEALYLADSVLSTFSEYTNVTATTQHDLHFSFFNANQTLNNSAAISGTWDGVGYNSGNSNGPTGQYGSEGSYGLILVGSANVANCNASSTCCDGYNASLGAVASCATGYSSVCAVLQAHSLAYDTVINSIQSRRGVPSNVPYSNNAPAVISFLRLDELISNKGASLPESSCGPQLRLTSSEARAAGAMWYARKMNVFEGFDTTIQYQISNPSLKCDRMDDVNTFCRSRGADGFAFVIQNVSPTALGNAGAGLGYEGIFNSLAVEMDTYHNYDQMDYYENHIAVMTQVITNYHHTL